MASVQSNMADDGNPTSNPADDDNRGSGHTTPPPAAMPLPRHYPLDIPDLPFCRYEHRRLTARDVMVHRIMSDYMNPRVVKPRTYDHHITYPNTFDPIKSADHRLGLDLQVLRKMLFTSYSNDSPPPNKPLVASIPARARPPPKPFRLPFTVLDPESVVTVVAGPRNQPPTLGDQVLDLVMRHYFETDDAAMRTWIGRGRPPRLSGARPARPVQQTKRQGKARTTRRGQFEDFDRMLDKQERRERKVWDNNDTAHLRNFQRQVAVQDELSLYDGGAFLPQLVQSRDEGLQGPGGVRGGVDLAHWAVTERGYDLLTMPTWPEIDPNVRFVLQPAWRHRKELKVMLKQQNPQPLDLGLNPGRGRNRDGVWTTGQTAWKRRGKADPDGVYRGRHARVRRRATSEPPPGSFTSADFPAPDPSVTETVLQVLFPRMTLAKLDARSRRRSLSRTRIEEMFDWDVSMTDRRTLTVKSTKLEAEEVPDSELSRPGSPASPRLEGRPPAAPQPPPAVHTQCKAKKKAKQKTKNPGAMRCQNCFDTRHVTSVCKASCGHCGAPNPSIYAQRSTGSYETSSRRTRSPPPRNADNEPVPAPFEHLSPHLAPTCPVARQNRCKCVPFPTWHTAARCPVPCKRDCGNPASKGSFKHRNAMTCRARCCMCGIQGHSGKECRLRKCRCGAAHLGQDCNWRPMCSVKGCGRYWCGLHCRECGSGEKPFVGWRCWQCLGNTEPFPPRTTHKKGRQGGRREGDLGGDAPDEEHDGHDCVVQVEPQQSGGEAGPASLFGDPRERLDLRQP